MHGMEGGKEEVYSYFPHFWIGTGWTCLPPMPLGSLPPSRLSVCDTNEKPALEAVARLGRAYVCVYR
jgi:hypothetical protein